MKYFIKTFGCQMNKSDSERIATFLEQQGYESVGGADSSADSAFAATSAKEAALAKADLIVINACSVRQTAIDRIFGLKPKILKSKALNPKFKAVLTGCILKSDRKKFEKFFDYVLDIKDFFHSPIFHDRDKKENYLEIKPKYLYKDSVFIPIMTGCDNFCSYCVVPYTRGREISRPVEEIICEIKTLIKNSYKEITLLGQNVNTYRGGLSSVITEDSPPINFAELLKLINKIPGNFQIKFLTSHPKDASDELVDAVANCKKVAKEIHLPIQSGDNEILRKMNRHYTVGQYKKLIEKIRKKIPGIKISTDVIVGFPSETKKQFENTAKAFKEIKFDKAYINKYSVRAGTLATKFKDDVPLEEKKRRWKILNDMVNQLQNDKPELIVALGPTASGKSELAIKLAKEFNGEIISADSRQVYKGMNIGTGKIPQDFGRFNLQKLNKYEEVEPPYIYKGVIHHCLDIASPRKQLTVAEYRKKALEAINKIYKKGKIPILCGGTGFYVQAVVEGLKIPAIKPDWKLRKELEKKSIEELFKELKKLDPERAKKIDSKNRRRLIRALEIIKKTGKEIPAIEKQPQFNALCIGIKKSMPELKKSINQRVDKMIKNGLEKEVKKLVKKYGWNIVLKNAIGYKEWKDSEDKKIIANAIKKDSYQYAKRQMTWFRKYPGNKINWIKTYPEAEKLTKKFLPR